MDGISRSCGWDKEFPHCVMEQLVLSDMQAIARRPRYFFARKFVVISVL